MTTRLARRLGTVDAVVIGLASMIGAGIFTAVGAAAAAAGGGLLLGLVVAGFVAYCNATSSAALAARFPESGGTYVYGREQLGQGWGFVAGWGFLAAKTARRPSRSPSVRTSAAASNATRSRGCRRAHSRERDGVAVGLAVTVLVSVAW